MNELLKAIMTRWRSDAGGRVREQCPGGLWQTEAPAGILDSGKTCCIYTVLPGSIMDTMSSKIEQPVIDFAFYQSDEDQSETGGTCVMARDAFVKVYDDVLLEMEDDDDGNSRRMIQAKRLYMGTLQKDPDEGFFCVVSYQFMWG